jgi:hypothetical protein
LKRHCCIAPQQLLLLLLLLHHLHLFVCLPALLQVDPAKALSDAEKLKRERQEEEEEERAQRLLQLQVGRKGSSAGTQQA